MLDDGLVQLLVAFISGAAVFGGGWLVYRQNNESNKIDAAANEAAGVLGGYDRLTAHLQRRVVELEEMVNTAYGRVRDFEQRAYAAESKVVQTEGRVREVEQLLERATADCQECTEKLESVMAENERLREGREYGAT